ncbi:MAG: phosphatase PAP2 family protein [Chloroflexaceae bacterium]|nr:phosphatase PAP2 family protein [Chloroflexaceae bacterium]
MEFFDTTILLFLNQFARMFAPGEFLLGVIVRNHLVKGGVLVTLLWWLWFQRREAIDTVRERVLLTLMSSLLALFAARLLSAVLPFRPRPIHAAHLNFTLPYGVPPDSLDRWSAFPSDHAILFFALATGIYFISRKLGIVVLIYVALVICFPRVYLGLHYPTDVLAGAAIGIGIVWGMMRIRVNTVISQAVMAWLQRQPGLFYAGFFLLTYQIGTMFDHVRAIAGFALDAFRAIIT